MHFDISCWLYVIKIFDLLLLVQDLTPFNVLTLPNQYFYNFQTIKYQ